MKERWLIEVFWGTIYAFISESTAEGEGEWHATKVPDWTWTRDAAVHGRRLNPEATRASRQPSNLVGILIHPL